MSRGRPLIRQWNLLKALQAHNYGVSSEALAKWIGCSKRQIQRDLRLLQEVGFPISFEQRDFGKRFWKLSPHFVESRGIVLSVTEILGLYLSKQLLAPLAGTQLGDGLATVIDKVKAQLPYEALNYFAALDETLIVKNIASQDYSRQGKKIHTINRAIHEGLVLSIRYKSISKKKAYDTQYHPYGMIFFDTNLYCIGYMAEYSEIRTLKVSRILSVELTNEHFERPSAFSLRTYFRDSFGIHAAGKPREVTVKLTSWAAELVREQKWHPSQKILKDKHDLVVVQFVLPNTTEFKRWLLGFGRYAAVIRPKSFANEMREELKAAARHYTGKS